MARFCISCGAKVSASARFCNACGGTLPEKAARLGQQSSAQATSQPTWSGWQSAPSPSTTATGAPSDAVAANPAANVAAATPAASTSNVSTPAPVASSQTAATLGSVGASGSQPAAAQASPSMAQSWDSYTYIPRDDSYSAPNESTYSPRRDASRPLPPIGDVFGNSSSDMELEDIREMAHDTITNFSLWAAGIVLFPVPFSDLVLLMPIQSAMVVSIGKLYGVKNTPEKLLALLAGSCGASVIGQVTVLLVAEFIPVVGKLISAPFVFGWTYGLGEVAVRYFESQGKATPDELRSVFKNSSRLASKSYGQQKIQPSAALDNIRDYVSEEEYQKIRERFGPQER